MNKNVVVDALREIADDLDEKPDTKPFRTEKIRLAADYIDEMREAITKVVDMKDQTSDGDYCELADEVYFKLDDYKLEDDDD